MKVRFFLAFHLLLFSFSYTQNIKKEVSALRIKTPPVIDGVLDEKFWQQAEKAKDFVMFRPGDGDKEKDHKTIVKVAYDNEAIYFGITMYDPKPSSIPKQFTARDNIGNSDFFLISINPNNDGLNDTEFIVTSAGTQADAKVTSSGEDFKWNAVWYSAIKFNANNWVAEIKIPYTALRFSNTKKQIWGVNFHRKIVTTNEQYSWSYIDKSSGKSITSFSGIITGIENIKPPLRLSFYPYASASYSKFKKNKNFNYSYGMDLKYGISESFTLDATLIPDFGQTAFDNIVLNLGPHEHRYSEKRAFFTEGTELFNKGGLFYSRRIGNSPTERNKVTNALKENEEVINNPSKVDMLNAVKVSGRTKKNLGIGFFNAITQKTSATIKNAKTNETREVVTEPFANYNVLVLDQQFNKTSSVTLINTNVMRNGHFRDANVTGLLFNIYNKNNTLYANGNANLSKVYENSKNNTGFYGNLRLGKTGGKHRYSLGFKIATPKYNINDLGFNTQNNFKNLYANYSYRIFKPKGIFDNYGFNVWSNISYLHQPNTYTSSNIGGNFWANTRKRNSFGANINLNGNHNDFYEPRTGNFTKFVKRNSSTNFNVWISSDYRKKIALDANFGGYLRFNSTEKSYWLGLGPRYRFNDKFQIRYRFEYDIEKNKKAYVTTMDNGNIIFGNRKTKKTITNNLSAGYSFNTKASISLTFRHYWSPVTYSNQYYTLKSNGYLTKYTNYNKNNNLNYNLWNLDLGYNWEFAKGSQLSILYRNSLSKENKLSEIKFHKNLNDLFNEPLNQTVSVKFIYYLDYNQVKTWL